jgi:hypothetical protein
MRRPNRAFLSAQPLNHLCLAYIKGTGKAILLHAWTEPEGFIKLRLPDFKVINIRMWYGYQPYAQTAFILQEIFLLFICVRG